MKMVHGVPKRRHTKFRHLPAYEDGTDSVPKRRHITFRHLPAHEDGTECSETSAYNIHTPENCTEESTQQ